MPFCGFCGNRLYLTIPLIYGPNKSVYCNNCLKEFIPSDIIYHCTNTNRHSKGFDLCTGCCQGSNNVSMIKHQIPISSVYTHNIHINECKFDIFKCQSLHRIRCIMNNLMNEKIQLNIDDFFHLVFNHSNSEQFATIYHELGGACDMKTCAMFKRNYRDRQGNFSFNNYSVSRQLIDRIHCYFNHSYDIRFKLSPQQLNIINSLNKYYPNNCFVDCQKLKMQQIINTGNKHINNIHKRLNKKFHQLNQDHNFNINAQNRNMFCFGIEFRYRRYGNFSSMSDYDYSSESSFDFNDGRETFHGQLVCDVFKKYSSLKDELIQNDVAVVSVEQYRNEYKKAHLHEASQYCKQNTFKGVTELTQFLVEILLSLMMYCNYDELSYQFSKTFREKSGKEHNNFYHFGRTLKIAVKRFGGSMHKCNVSALYHGINDKLILPRYVGSQLGGQYGIFILCPLSTTSAYEVAVNFANSDKGLIIEFGDSKYGSDATYFDVSWLSDYTNEREYLFLQNSGPAERLEINNIFEPEYGYEYVLILNALKIIENITSDTRSYDQSENTINYKRNNRRFQSELHNPDTSNIDSLVEAMFSDQLSSISSYSRFNSLSDYGRQMMKIYFQNKTKVMMNYPLIQNQYPIIFSCCFRSTYEWIKFKEFSSLFPNVEE
eukprot:116988_1